MTRRGRWIAGLALAGAILTAALAARFGPAFSLALALASPTTEGWLASLGAPVRREEIQVSVGERVLHADVYRPAHHRGALLLVHGLSRTGPRQPDLARLARLVAERGLLVMVPRFEGLAAFRLTGTEVDDIRGALEHLRRLANHVGVAGFSFGAGPMLLAAAEVPELRVVGSFGGYADLRHVIAFITTGVHHWGGQRLVQRQEEYNRWKALALLVAFVEHRGDRATLGAIATRKLTDPGGDTVGLEGDLGPGGRAMLALVLNRREEAVEARIQALPAGVSAALERLSPRGAVARIRARLLIAHGAGDTSIPFTESLHLAAAAPSPPRLVILQSFQHTRPQPEWTSVAGALSDGWGLLRLADDLLALR
ncbi:MAG: alpha/beta hydrolase family protein [Candidatus Rokuibacteriota bacterium]